MTAQSLIARYQLSPHPEGGWYREVHRSSRLLANLSGYPGERAALTAIYFLLAAGEFSAFHRVQSEEAWVHLAGAPLEIILLQDEPTRCTLAAPGEAGEPLVVVPGGVLQAARTLGEWTLVSCLVAPGFDFSDFSIPSRAELERAFPRHVDLVRCFSRAFLSESRSFPL